MHLGGGEGYNSTPSILAVNGESDENGAWLESFRTCSRQNNAPFAKSIHILVSKICEYLALYVKKDFADPLKLRILRYGDFAWLSGCAWCNYKGLHKRETRESKAEKDGMTEADRGTMSFEEEKRDNEPRNAGSFQKLKVKKK